MKRTIPFVLAAVCACSVVLGPDAATDAQSVYDSLWRDFDRHYSYFEHKNIDWAAQGAAFRPAPNASPTTLFAAIRNLTNVLDDPHVTVRAPTGTSQSGVARATQRTFYSQAIALSYVSQSQMTPSLQMRFGRLSSRIGYVRIPSFGGSGWGPDIEITWRVMPNVEAWVIDARDNGGGNNGNAMDIANRFADESRTVGFYRYRSGPKHSDFTTPSPVNIIPAGTRFDGPVAVLCNRRCASATEDFVMRMRAIPQVVTIGDTTMGAVGNPIQRELANGWSYQFSEWQLLTPAMQIIEDAGFAPAIVVPGTQADSSAGVDRALERAIAELSARLSASPRRTTSPP